MQTSSLLPTTLAPLNNQPLNGECQGNKETVRPWPIENENSLKGVSLQSVTVFGTLTFNPLWITQNDRACVI